MSSVRAGERSLSFSEAKAGLPKDSQKEQFVGGMRKRGFDIVFACLAVFLLLPLFAFAAIMIKLSDGGPVFYRHTRIGAKKSSFGCLKFRTMAVDGDKILSSYLERHPERRREWDETQKLRDDPRIMPVGLVLRQLSLDELPQLINVLLGDMSIVGPRPIVVDEIERYGQDARFYFAARPGMTGKWQVSGRSDVSYRRRVELDRSYVEHWSFATDLAIIAKTIPAVVLAKGSY